MRAAAIAVVVASILHLRPAAAQAPPTAATPAATQQAPSATQQAPAALTPAEQQELEKALAADAAANAARTPLAAAPPPATGSSFLDTLTRGFQSLNPDLSAIIDFGAGVYYSPSATEDARFAPPLLSGDDPGQTGFNLQELELGFSATVDPYFKGNIYLTIPNTKGIEIEEAYLTTTSLPWSLQLRAGVMRASFGRQNTQHLHQQFFTRRPTLNALLLGPDGLRAPGMELSWLVPLPFYLLVSGAAYSVAPADDPNAPVATFGGGRRTDFSYVANARTFVDFSDSTSLLLGLSFAKGRSSQAAVPGGTILAVLDDHDSYLYGADAYLKWKPPNVSKTYMSVAWTTEFLLRDLPDFHHRLEGALYSQVVWQTARRWFLGVRGEIDGLPSGPSVGRAYAAMASLTWQLSEFALARVNFETRFPESRNMTLAGFLQLEASLGAHGAHPY